MIKIRFNKKDGLLTGFECKGHSNLGEAGSDILCAFVSSACYMCANTVTEVLKLNAVSRDADGFMRLEIKEQSEKAQDILNGTLLHFTELEKQYPENIKVLITEE